MKLSAPKLHNKYYMELRRKDTQELKQVGYAENTVLQAYFYQAVTGGHRYGGATYIHFGNGTSEPQYTDTKLSSQLWYCNAAKKVEWLEVDDYTICLKATYVVPAETTYVGDLTEVGLSEEYYSNIWTKALIKDAEGNLISIHKTDLDELTVVVEFYVQRDSLEGFVWNFGHGSALHYLNSNSILGIQSPFGGTCNSGGGSFSWHPGLSRHLKYPSTFLDRFSTRFTWDSAQSILSMQDTRILATKCNTHYINSLSFWNDNSNQVCLDLCFPSSLFPAYTVSNMSVGVGDGVQTEFEPPLGLWIKDTDKVYVDGVLQVRDVDYTIDHKANRTRLKEITPGNFVKSWHTEKEVNKPTNCKVDCGRIPFAYLATVGLPGMQVGNAFLMELEEDPSVGLDINYWIPGMWYRWYASGSPSSGNANNCVFILSYSIDGETYVEVDRYTYNSSTCNEPRDFETIKAKYWKLECTNVAEGDLLYLNVDQQSRSGFWYSLCCIDTNRKDCLGYYGKPIKFTNPPADGAVITMECQLDRPYKNENFVIDIAPQFQF